MIRRLRKRPVWLAASVLLASLVILLFYSQPGLPTLEVSRENPVAKVPNFSKYRDVEQKKQAFFDFLYPIIEEENIHLLEIRRVLQDLANKNSWAEAELDWIDELTTLYIGEDNNESTEQRLTKLLRRVDMIPPSLVLAQAAIESAWGTSRFAREGNNLFGQWCFSKGCGLVPHQRADGKHHEVARFDTVNDSVSAYLKNLNAFRAYQSLREARLQARIKDAPLRGSALVKGLGQYSEQGDAYLAKVQRVIAQNSLGKMDERFLSTQLAKN